MNIQWKRFSAVVSALLLAGAVAAAAADNPTLEIQSPAANATVRGNAVIITFKTRGFKIVGLNHMVTPGASARNTGGDEQGDMGNPAANATDSGQMGSRATTAGGIAQIGGNGGGNSPETIPSEAPPPPSQAQTVNPREGFMVVAVDTSPFYFIHSTGDPLLLAGLQPGPHQITMLLVTADLKPNGVKQTLNFTVGGAAAPAPAAH